MSIKEMIFDKTTIPLLSKGLDAYSRRQRTIAHNVANIETPGYQRHYVKFEDELKQLLESRSAAMKVTDSAHLPFTDKAMESFDSHIEVDTDTPAINGVNNVSIDQEMADLATNNLQYQTASKLIRQYFDAIKTAIRGGGGA